MKLQRRQPSEQIGRHIKPGQFEEVFIQGSLQPTGRETLRKFPEGQITENSMSLYIMGRVAVNIGDFVVTDDSIRWKVTALESDWADLGNYRKYLVEKVRE
jgi:hypothetical protein